jgi:hypothetical protein
MLMATLPLGRHSVSATSEGTAAPATGNLPRPARSANCLSRLRKCHENETQSPCHNVRTPTNGQVVTACYAIRAETLHLSSS